MDPWPKTLSANPKERKTEGVPGEQRSVWFRRMVQLIEALADNQAER